MLYITFFILIDIISVWCSFTQYCTEGRNHLHWLCQSNQQAPVKIWPQAYIQPEESLSQLPNEEESNRTGKRNSFNKKVARQKYSHNSTIDQLMSRNAREFEPSAVTCQLSKFCAYRNLQNLWTQSFKSRETLYDAGIRWDVV